MTALAQFAGLSAREIAARLPSLSAEQAAELDLLLTDGMPVWMAQTGPQMRAMQSQADVLYYGGQAGGGKTDLLIGLALTQHRRSIIFRRQAVQLVGIEDRVATVLGSRKGYNSQDGVWRLPNDRVLELGSVKEAEDWMKYQGRPHSLKAFDEIPHFMESQFRALIGWLRTEDPNERCRVVCAGNPPTDSDGEWVIRYWAPWLDPQHPRPASDGELRWFVTDEQGRDLEVPGPERVKVGSEWMTPKSRTFIRSSVDDNLFLDQTGYKATLQSLPEPLRSQMLRGDFLAGRSDPVWQAIPTDWIRASQARWQPRAEKGQMTALGFDPCRGGKDKACAARRHGTWFDELVQAGGSVVTDGPTAAAFVVPLLRDGAPVVIDAIGIGGAALDFLRGLNLNVHPMVGSEGSPNADATGKLRFRNRRAEMYWRVREALDPTNPRPIALPPDKELFEDLAAVRYKVVQMGAALAGLQMRDKDEIREVLGRSPDRGDSVAMTFMDGIPEPLFSEGGRGSRYIEAPPPDWRM